MEPMVCAKCSQDILTEEERVSHKCPSSSTTAIEWVHLIGATLVQLGVVALFWYDGEAEGWPPHETVQTCLLAMLVIYTQRIAMKKG